MSDAIAIASRYFKKTTDGLLDQVSAKRKLLEHKFMFRVRTL